jgi:hypothetical protein
MTNENVVQSPEPILAWTAHSIPHHERSARWYLIATVAAVCLIAYGILTGAWTMSLLTMLLAGLYFLLRRQQPTYSQMAIAENGFTWNGIFTPWNGCAGFWLIHTPRYSELHIWRNAGRPHDTVIQTDDIDLTTIRAVLSRYLTERTDRKEEALEKIIRLLKL